MIITELLGKTPREVIAELGAVGPETSFMYADNAFSIYVDDNEYMFAEDTLVVVKLSNFACFETAWGFAFQNRSVEQFLSELTSREFAWEICEAGIADHRFFIFLPELRPSCEVEFERGTFVLKHIRCSIYPLH